MKTYKLMWKMILYRPWFYLLNGILWTLIHITPLLPGLVTREFFDRLGKNGTIDMGTWGILSLIVVIALSRVVIIFFGVIIDIVYRFNISSLLRCNMLKSILKKPGAASTEISNGEIINSFRDDAEQAEYSISGTLDVIGTAIFAVTAIVILSSISVRITFFAFAPLVAVVVIAEIASRKIEKYRKASREATGKVSGTIGEMFTYVQAVKASGAEDDIINHLKFLNKQRHKMMLKDSVLRQVIESIFGNTVSLGTGLILLLATQSMNLGTFTIGDFSLFAYYLTFVTEFIQLFGSYIADYPQTCVSFKRMNSLVKGKNDDSLVKHNKLYLKGELPETKCAELVKEDNFKSFRVKNLTYLYEGSGKGIDNIDFTLKRGTLTVITGRIGSGKTTLLRTLLGLLPKDSGEIYWNTNKVEDVSDFFVSPRCAYTAQVPHLFSDTVKNNVLIGIPKGKEDLDKAIHLSVLEEDIASFENGIETVVGPRGVKLSGGQIQRVAAARMFARNTELYVLDDISSALDVETENKLWTRIFEETNKTYLVVSNKRIALSKANNIIVLKDGHVEDIGRLDELLERCDEMKAIWG